ncbi:hypothetical protein MXD61_08385 [Frankia sp. AgPm24]|uniref:hypothetical protein n=1 Tax=Frankia sp. AgPm24 TaxID=631128 RepID=UPI00200DC668|nr:hypothetical protein [Frankia sp. AgPm24]MCK9921901.1 hypothetical protein [Frankia sp. AgPm24]
MRTVSGSDANADANADANVGGDTGANAVRMSVWGGSAWSGRCGVRSIRPWARRLPGGVRRAAERAATMSAGWPGIT